MPRSRAGRRRARSDVVRSLMHVRVQKGTGDTARRCLRGDLAQRQAELPQGRKPMPVQTAVEGRAPERWSLGRRGRRARAACAVEIASPPAGRSGEAAGLQNAVSASSRLFAFASSFVTRLAEPASLATETTSSVSLALRRTRVDPPPPHGNGQLDAVQAHEQRRP